MNLKLDPDVKILNEYNNKVDYTLELRSGLSKLNPNHYLLSIAEISEQRYLTTGKDFSKRYQRGQNESNIHLTVSALKKYDSDLEKAISEEKERS